jgi:NDP-sugar pyrophosphorylase family protein
MQIIIPMTGYGSRFKAAGYKRLKPFIEVNNHPIVEWVVKMFPGDEDKIIFVCRKEHLDTLDYAKKELERIAPKSQIFAIDDWEKKGPVNDVLRASNIIDDHEQVIICYCDYYMHWDYKKFKEDVLKRGCDGAIPCYSGFHPNLIPEKNLYATCKVDEKENLIEIREKFSWEKDKIKSRHSPGIYYFKSGAILKKYCKAQIEADDNIKGEYYASVTYNYLVKDGLKVWCPVNVPQFCQWGTPEDMEEYLFYINCIKNFLHHKV